MFNNVWGTTDLLLKNDLIWSLFGLHNCFHFRRILTEHMMGKCNRHMIKYPRLQFVQIMLLLHFFSFCKFGYVKNKYIDLDSSSYSYKQFWLQLKKLIINYVTKFIFIYQYIRLDTFNAKVNVKEIICGEKWCTMFRLNVCFVYQRKE